MPEAGQSVEQAVKRRRQPARSDEAVHRLVHHARRKAASSAIGAAGYVSTAVGRSQNRCVVTPLHIAALIPLIPSTMI